MYPVYPTKASMERSMAVGSGEPCDLSIASDHSSSSARSSGATPSMSPMTAMGSGAAMSATKSQRPFSHTVSRMASQATRTESSMARTRRGVKPSETSRRRRTCSGASKSIIIGSAGDLGRMPCALENDSVSTEACFTVA